MVYLTWKTDLKFKKENSSEKEKLLSKCVFNEIQRIEIIVYIKLYEYRLMSDSEKETDVDDS